MKSKINTKPKCIYIKNIYIQPSKIQKLCNSTNTLFENKKIISDHKANNHLLNINNTEKRKAYIKSFCQNNCQQNKTYIIKENPSFLTSKNNRYKSTTKKIKDNLLPLNICSEEINSGRRTTQKNYEIINPFKERSNSENSLNCFNRSYTFFNNKDNQSSYLKAKPTDKAIKINASKKKDQANISCTKNNKKIYNYKNISEIQNANKKNSLKSKNSSCSCSISRKNSKKYFYQDQTYKVQKNQNQINPMSPNVNINLSTNNNISAISTPISYKQNNYNNNTTQNHNRIKKYIYSDKERKPRQYVNDYKENLCNSICIKKELELYNKINLNKNFPKRSDINEEEKKNKSNKNMLNSTFSPITNNFDNKSNFLNYNWIKENSSLYFNRNTSYNFQNIIDSNNYFDSSSSLEGYTQDFKKKEVNGINVIREKVLFEQSALIIQSAFRGYLSRRKLDTLLYNYKGYNKASEILEQIFNLKYKKDINIQKQEFLNYLKEKAFDYKYSNINDKSCKNFKLLHLPSSPCTDTDALNKKNQFLDIYLHKEIGERFNIIKQNENKEKELEKKHKEELDGVNSKMNELIEENNKLKDINEKNKLNESRYRELSLENKKKENIINIITNDNLNLARKLKIINNKNNYLQIHKQSDIKINLENNELCKYNNPKELYNNYRNFYLYYLIHKKNDFLLNICRKYFNRYKNIINIINDNNKLKDTIREQQLNYLMIKLKNKENKNKYINFIKLYFNSLLNYKESENKNNIIKEKLINIILNKERRNKLFLKICFQKFYYKGINSQLYEENNENLKLMKEKKLNNLKKAIISIECRKINFFNIKLRNIFDKWNIISKLLAMKAVTDEKKRKKRQKQRTKKKIEKNRSANKYLSNSNSISTFHFEKNNINIFNKDNKDKEIFNYLEHSVTTDLSGPEINVDNKADKLTKATEKLNEIFFKAAMYYKLNGKNINSNLNGKKVINENEEKNINDKKEIKDNNEDENNSDEDSGESSFGI